MSSKSDKYGEFWSYLSQTQKDLILEGDYLMNVVIRNSEYSFKDYSFLVFPFAKAYEGYLKQLFKDIGFLNNLQYISDHLRLGKLMSPNLVSRLGDRSLYIMITKAANKELSEEIWQTWKLGRNQIFHYFPHNLRSITFQEAEEIISKIINSMEDAYQELKIKSSISE